MGAGYGIPTPGMIEAAGLLDPVYSGKGMTGLIDLVRNCRFGPDDNFVFLHTGGSAGLFATLRRSVSATTGGGRDRVIRRDSVDSGGRRH